ncbi:winged helix-turn-helix domain-containing protein [Tepidiforma sp.]|uniref:winged helix-turn-helix domain-containing protein n=1 Tax=Tepidiforma sp. TaxID=2682230 RepID=UPI002ADDE2AB|nr:winged helix-turn-helix domain-containing protein [Tepidiforma sp.]
MDWNEVETAFDILIEEIELVVNELRESGAEAFRAGDDRKARQTLDTLPQLTEFRERVRALQREWKKLTGGRIAARKAATPRTQGAKLRRGLRTQEDEFRRPILEALVELGGSAPIGDVLDKVGAKMRGILKEHDYEPLRSAPRTPRWRNTAQWCRNTLVKEGLMKHGSPEGVWEITEEGRRWLAASDSA